MDRARVSFAAPDREQFLLHWQRETNAIAFIDPNVYPRSAPWACRAEWSPATRVALSWCAHETRGLSWLMAGVVLNAVAQFGLRSQPERPVSSGATGVTCLTRPNSCRSTLHSGWRLPPMDCRSQCGSWVFRGSPSARRIPSCRWATFLRPCWRGLSLVKPLASSDGPASGSSSRASSSYRALANVTRPPPF